MDEISNNELTFKRIWELCKKGWINIIVAVLVSILLLTTILVSVQLGIKEEDYVATVRFNRDELANGKTLFGNDFDYSNIVKMSSVINNALLSCGYTEDEIKEMSSLIQKATSANIIVDEEEDQKTNTNKFQNYKVSVSKVKSLKLTTTQFNAITNAIVQESIKYVKSINELSISFVDINAIDYTITNYAKAYSLLANEIDSMETIVNSLINVDSTFVCSETKKSFLDVKNKVENLKINLNSLIVYMSKNAVVNTSNTRDSEVDYISQINKTLEVELIGLENSITSLETIVDHSKPVIMGDNMLQFGLSSADYYALIKDLQNKKELYNQKKSEKEVWNNLVISYSGVLKTDNDSQNTIKSMENTMIKDLTSIYEDLTKMVNNYNEVKLMEDSIAVVSPAQKVITSNLDVMIILLIELVGILVAVIVALMVTNKNEKLKV